MIYYLVYKVTNLVNGKIYIGCHKTNNLDDGYMGSGSRLYYAKKKYGIENFKKEILKFCESTDEMLAEEAQIVNEKFLQRNDVYNLTVGGLGSWFFTNSSPAIIRARNAKCTQLKLDKIKNDPVFRQRISAAASVHNTAGHSAKNNKLHNKNKPQCQKGAKRSEECKRKQSLSHTGRKNSQFGTVWVYHPELKCSQKILKENIMLFQVDGWMRGRIISQINWNSSHEGARPA